MLALFANATTSEESNHAWMIAGWVAAIIAAVVGPAATWWFTKKRGRHVLVTKVESNTLLHISNKVKEKISIAYDGTPVKALSHLKVAITNSDTDALKNIELKFTFPDTTFIMDYELSREEGIISTAGSNSLALQIPYLNSFALHKDSIQLEFLCEGTVDGLRVDGSGENWSAKYISSKRLSWARDGFIFAVSVPLGLAVSVFVLFELGTRKDPVVPFLVAFAISMVLYRWIKPPSQDSRT